MVESRGGAAERYSEYIGEGHETAVVAGILGVTTRPAVRARVLAVSGSLALPCPRFVGNVIDTLEVQIESAVLLLDLGSCCQDAELLPLVQAWTAFHPETEVVLFTPLLDRETELRITVLLVREVRSAEVRVLTASDFYRDEVWRNLWGMRERALLHAELRTELLGAIQALGRTLPAAPIVLQVLGAAASEHGLPGSRMPADGARAQNDRERKSTWLQLRRSGQLPASWLEVIFRLLWHAKLRDRGWSAPRIAQFLGFESARHFRLAVSRRIGIGIKDLRRLPYDDALRWAANVLTTPKGALDERSVRALMRPLLAGAGRAAPAPNEEYQATT